MGHLHSPFIHANFAPHLLDNTIPLVFMGVIIALAGAARLAWVTFIVILVGGLGTWLIAPAGHVHDRRERRRVRVRDVPVHARAVQPQSGGAAVGIVVGVVWGGALLASVVPHYGVSWQAHVCGAIGGVVAAAVMSRERPARGKSAEGRPEGLPAALS